MVTTRSQDKTTFADAIRAKGFSLADCKFLKLYATIMVAACTLYPETMQPLFA